MLVGWCQHFEMIFAGDVTLGLVCLQDRVVVACSAGWRNGKNATACDNVHPLGFVLGFTLPKNWTPVRRTRFNKHAAARPLRLFAMMTHP